MDYNVVILFILILFNGCILFYITIFIKMGDGSTGNFSFLCVRIFIFLCYWGRRIRGYVLKPHLKLGSGQKGRRFPKCDTAQESLKACWNPQRFWFGETGDQDPERHRLHSFFEKSQPNAQVWITIICLLLTLLRNVMFYEESR